MALEVTQDAVDVSRQADGRALPRSGADVLSIGAFAGGVSDPEFSAFTLVGLGGDLNRTHARRRVTNPAHASMPVPTAAAGDGESWLHVVRLPLAAKALGSRHAPFAASPLSGARTTIKLWSGGVVEHGANDYEERQTRV